MHRLGDRRSSSVWTRRPASSHWQFRYATEFEDRYGYNNGPRASPVIDGDRVFTVGAEGQAALPGAGVRHGGVEARPAGRVQGAAGFFRHRLDAAGGRPAADSQRRRAGRTVCRGPRQGHRPRGVARRQGVGAELRLARSGDDARQAPRVRVCGRRVGAADRRADVDRPGERAGRFRLSVAQPHPRFGQRLLPGGVRQQGVRLGELSHRKRARRGAAGLHAPGGVDDAGVRAALQYRDLPRRLPLRVRRPQRARRLAGLRRRGQRESGVAGDAGVDRDLRGARRARGSRRSAPIGDRCSRPTASSCAWARSDTCCG